MKTFFVGLGAVEASLEITTENALLKFLVRVSQYTPRAMCRGCHASTYMSCLLLHILLLLIKAKTVKIKHDLVKAVVNVPTLLLLAFKL